MNEENRKVAEAWKLLEQHGLDETHVKKHWDRVCNNRPVHIRFIDRHPFKAIDTEDLPF